MNPQCGLTIFLFDNVFEIRSAHEFCSLMPFLSQTHFTCMPAVVDERRPFLAGDLDDCFRLDCLVACAALGVEEAQQFLQGLRIR